MIPKNIPVRNRALLDLAHRLNQCTLNIPGVCTGYSVEGLEPAHSNWAEDGKGKSLKAHDNLHAAGAIKAAVNGDRNFYHDLHRLVSRGHMKRETLLGHYVYSLDTKAARIERERKRAARKALELQKKETAKRAAAIKAQKARTARIAKLRREIACRQAALQRLGC